MYSSRNKLEIVPIHVEIWICSRLISNEKEIFTKQELTKCIEKEFFDTRPGISTHISSVCVANKKSNHPINYNYLISIGRGEYRIFKEDDCIHPSKTSANSRPEIADIPERYRYLLDEQSNAQELKDKYRHLIPEEALFESSSKNDYLSGPINFKALKKSENEAISRTILMMAYNPSCARIFSKQANIEIKNLIYEILYELPNITNQAEFNEVHKNMLDRIVQTIKNLRKNRKNREITYGQAQKGLNVFLKVYIDWANLPTPEIANVIRPFLHCPLDSVVMLKLKKNENHIYRIHGKPPCNLRSIVTYNQYLGWQNIIEEITKRENFEKRTILDVIWYLDSLKKKVN